MTEERLPSKFAFILHTDVAGSTGLVQQDEELAHKRIQDTFRRFSDIITQYHGQVRELRGDALLAEFERASDAVTAALAFQAEQSDFLAHLDDNILPTVRVGIAMGEVIIADDTITGEGVVLAQRVEQLAEPGGVCITGAIQETLPTRLPFDQVDLGEQQVKGFDSPVRVYTVALKKGATLPEPTVVSGSRRSKVTQFAIIATVVVLIFGAGLFSWFQPWQPDFEPASVENMALPLPDKPSIAVLPFDAYSGESEQKHFANGLTEDLITTLSKVPGLFVIARTSTQKYKGKDVDIREVAKEQGVRYILEGSVQKSGDSVRINVQLVDGTNAQHVWAETYDRPATEFFAIQDDIVKQVGTQMQVKLTEGDHARIVSSETKSLKAWLLRNAARATGSTWTPEGFVRARELYQAAHEADPTWGRPLAGLAWVNWAEAWRNFSKDREESIAEGVSYAKQAIELDPESPIGYAMLGSLMALKGDWDQTIALREKAVEIAPNDVPMLAGLAGWLAMADEEERALEIYRHARKISPIVPWWMLRMNGLALHMDGHHEAAIQVYKESVERRPQWKPIHPRLAAVYADLGRYDEATNEIGVYLEAKPEATMESEMATMPFKEKTRAEWYADLLRNAGMPE